MYWCYGLVQFSNNGEYYSKLCEIFFDENNVPFGVCEVDTSELDRQSKRQVAIDLLRQNSEEIKFIFNQDESVTMSVPGKPPVTGSFKELYDVPDKSEQANHLRDFVDAHRCSSASNDNLVCGSSNYFFAISRMKQLIQRARITLRLTREPKNKSNL